MNFDITTIIQAVIALAAAVITTFVVPWIKSKTTAEQRVQLTAWVKIAVAAAEQIYKGSGRGDEKKQYVIEFLNKNGISFNEDVVNAAVKQLNSEGIIIS